MKKIFKISMSLPVVLLLAGCSSEDLHEPSPQGSYEMQVTISTGTTRADGWTSGLPEENALNENRLYIGTYSEQGFLKHGLYQAGVVNPDTLLNVRYSLSAWGPTLNFRLPQKEYEGETFFIGAFSVPAQMSDAMTELKGLADDANNTLKWPVTTDNCYWKPTEDRNGSDHIPMAGLTKIDISLMEGYNTVLEKDSPFILPDISLTRAMAKIVIEDLDGIIETVTLKTPSKGKLLPYLPSVLDSSVAMQPVEPAGGKGTLLNQKLSSPTETVTMTVDGESREVKRYVFYTYEWSFLEYGSDGKTVTGIKGVNHKDREIITLTANEWSGLKGSEIESTQISFAPHESGFPATTENLNTLDGGAWQGVMRNTVYTFRVRKPSTRGGVIETTVKPWASDKEF